MNIKSFIDDLDLTPDVPHRCNCPNCHGRNTFTVTHMLDGNIVWNCYKASCGMTGAIHRDLPSSYIKSALSGASRSKKASLPFNVPETFVKNRNEIHDFRSLWHLDGHVELFYDVLQNRIVFPVYEGATMVDAVGRIIDKKPRKNTAKWYRYGNSSVPYNIGSHKIAVLVEDAISAAAVYLSTGLSGVAIMGTSLSSGHLNFLTSRYNRVIVALDPDAMQKTLTIAKELRPYADIRVMYLNDDLKYRNEHDIDTLIQLGD